MVGLKPRVTVTVFIPFYLECTIATMITLYFLTHSINICLFQTTKTVLSTTRPYRLHEITEVDMMDPPMLVIANEEPLDGPDLV